MILQIKPPLLLRQTYYISFLTANSEIDFFFLIMVTLCTMVGVMEIANYINSYRLSISVFSLNQIVNLESCFYN